VCGTQIVAGDFDKGRAITIESKNYCYKCRPDAPDPSVPTVQLPSIGAPPEDPSGSRILKAMSESGRRAHRTATPPPRRAAASRPPSGIGRLPRVGAAAPPRAKHKTPILIAAGAGLLLIVGLLVALAMRGGKDPKKPPEPEGAQPPIPDVSGSPSETAWAEMQKYRQEHPGDDAATLAYFESRLGRITDPKIRAQAEEAIAGLRVSGGGPGRRLAEVIAEIDRLSVTEDLPMIRDKFLFVREQAEQEPALAKQAADLKTRLGARVQSEIPPMVEKTSEDIEELKKKKDYRAAIKTTDNLVRILAAAAEFGSFDEPLKQARAKKRELEQLANE
jgi:hypothetical protein